MHRRSRPLTTLGGGAERPRRAGAGRFVGLVVTVGLGTAACARKAPQDTLKPQGSAARTIDHLFIPVFWVAVAVFVLVQGLLLLGVFRFKDRGDEERPEPVQVHGNTRLEVGWTIAPALLLAAVAAATIPTIFSLARTPAGSMNVTVIGHQFWWEYRYPDLGVVTANELHMPAGRTIKVTLAGGDTDVAGNPISVDVIHSFWVPRLNGKTDYIPGRTNHMKLKADHPGTYLGQCVEFCGLSHANMRLRAVVQSKADFDTWVAEQKHDAATPVEGQRGYQGWQLFTAKGCAGCHTIGGYSKGLVGPNLTHLQARKTFAAGLFDLNAGNLRTWLRNPPGEKPGSRMPNLKLTDDEISQLVAYLETLK